MDDLERAVLYSFDQSTDANSQLRATAQAFCDQARRTPGIWRVCMQKFADSPFAEVQFWCLQVLDETVRVNYANLSSEEAAVLRAFLLSPFGRQTKGLGAGNHAFENHGNSGESPNGSFEKTYNPHQTNQAQQIFVRNKLAQVIVRLIGVEYPDKWPSVFLDLIDFQRKSDGLIVDMVCRVFSTLDKEIISLEYPRTQEEIAVAVRIKDAMRLQCVPQLIDSWYQIAISHQKSIVDIAIFVLEIVPGYITWIDINLVVNETWISLFMNILLTKENSPKLRCAAVECLLAIVLKKMEPLSKLSLLKRLQITQVCGGLIHGEEGEFAEKIAILFTATATELLECYKKFETAGFSEIPGVGEAKTLSQIMLDEVLSPVLFLLENADEDENSSTSIIQFILSYVGFMKGATLTETQNQQLQKILSVLFSKMQYPSEFITPLEEPSKEGREEEERMFEYRKEVYALLRSITRVSPSITYSFIHSTLSSVLSNMNSNFERLEAILSLVYQLGEGFVDETNKPGNGILGEFVKLILSFKLVNDSHRVVALLKMEIINRYVKFLQQNVDYVPPALSLFLGDCGLFHKNPSVSSRACYLFSRMAKQLRNHLLPFLEHILQGLHSYTLSIVDNLRMTKGEKNLKIDTFVDDRLYSFEAIGILIGLDDVPSEKASSYLSLFLSPLCNKIDSILQNGFNSEDPETIWSLNQIIIAISYLSKGFGEQISIKRPKISELFREAVRHVLNILQVFPKNQILRSKVISFLHRMLDILGEGIFSFIYLPLQQLISECEAKDMCEFFQLLNQLMNKFKSSSSPLIAQMLKPVTTKLSSLIPSDFASFQLTNTEEVREIHDIHKAYSLFLQTICLNNLLDVFLMFDNSPCFTYAINLLVDISSTHPDMAQRKIAVQVFIRLVKGWLDSQPEKIPGLKKFVIETFFPVTCLNTILKFDFDFGDANSFAFFGETVSCQKFICEKCGEDFFVFLNRAILPSLPCTLDSAQQYLLHLRNSDVKELKKFLKTFILGIRTSMQQNVHPAG